MSDLQTSQLTSTNAGAHSGAHSGASAPQPPNTLSQELPPAPQPDPEQEQVPVSSTPNPVSGGPISLTGTPVATAASNAPPTSSTPAVSSTETPMVSAVSNAPTSSTPVVSSTGTPVVTATSNAPTSSTDTPVVTAASTAPTSSTPTVTATSNALAAPGPLPPPPGSLISDKGNIYTPPPRPPVVRRGKGEKVTSQERGPPRKTGLRFFESRKDDYETASEKKVAGSFYMKMSKLYIVKYGYELGDDEDFAVDVADPPDWVANKVVNEKLAPEEEKFRQEFYTKLRDRLGQWYRHTICQPSQRGQGDLQRVIWQTWGGRTETAMLTATPPFLLGEAEMVREREREHDIRVKAWKESMADGPNRTPEEFSASLKSAAHYLQPFVDTIAERFGMCVSILMVGPIGERGGRIEMRSVHSGKTRGVVEKDWPLHDPEGFTRVQSSMVDFGHHVFSRTECEARVTLVQEPEEPVAPGPATLSSLSTAAATSSMAAGAQSTAAGSHAGSAAPAAAAGVSARQRQAAGVGAQAGDDGGRWWEENPEDTTSAQAGDDGGVGPEPNEGEGSGGGDENLDAQVEKLWKRRDAAKWTVELTRAHTTFECGKTWGGIEWASLVDRFFDFEAAWGPDALDWWISRGRKWEKKGRHRGAGRCEDARDVCVEMVELVGEGPAKDRSDWAPMLKLHGKNGMLQIMVSLLWWGERVADGSPADAREWSSAVEDVAETFREMLRPGVIAKFKKATERGGTDAAKGKKRKAAEGERQERRQSPVDAWELGCGSTDEKAAEGAGVTE
ncbi:hypothetical protein B0H14DRAFT_2617076 [Mycena olivaceomarginata]|nr:hypothetical protein B0H14DRAFT_2617076 [Mycena olivaceomarginata]